MLVARSPKKFVILNHQSLTLFVPDPLPLCIWLPTQLNPLCPETYTWYVRSPYFDHVSYLEAAAARWGCEPSAASVHFGDVCGGRNARSGRSMQNSGRHGEYLFGFRDSVDKVQGEGSRVKVIITHFINNTYTCTQHPTSLLTLAPGGRLHSRGSMRDSRRGFYHCFQC